jgi:hypothetical protein
MEAGAGPMPGHGPYRIGDGFLLKPRRTHLVEEGLKEVVVVPVHQHHIEPFSRKNAGGPDAAESHAYDDNPFHYILPSTAVRLSGNMRRSHLLRLDRGQNQRK